MGVTAAQIEKALRSVGGYGGQPWSMQHLADGANEAMQLLGITTAKGAACFIAQCMVESAYYRRTEEVRDRPGTALYKHQGTYWTYRGRTFIQLTYSSNYRVMGQEMKALGEVNDSEYFVKNPARLGDSKWKWLGPVAYWRRNNLVGLANRGENLRVGMGIHAGDPYADRRGYPWAAWGRTRIDHTTRAYNACLAAGITAPGPTAFRYDMPDFDGCWTVRRVQRNVGVPDDGVYGPATRDAVKKAQDTLGVKTDGLWGEKTQAAMVKAQKAGTYPRPDKDEPKVEKQPASKPKKKPWRYDMPTGGMSVKQVQRIVGVPDDGIYGRSTRAGVRKLQRKLKVKPRDGLWGKSTEKAWKRSQRKSNLLERGDKGRKVRKLQRKMNRVFPAYSSLTVDGIYGAATERAIEAFQRRSNLAVDGVVGPKTRRALARSGVKI